MKLEPVTRVAQWIRDYVSTRTHRRETMNVVFELKQLRDFISYIDHQNIRLCDTGNTNESDEINAVRFYFVRQNDIVDLTPENGNDRRDPVFIDERGQKQTQISLVAVPVLNYYRNTARHTFDGTDYDAGNDNVHCIYPYSNLSEHTGLCPYNCKGSLNELSPQVNEIADPTIP